MSVKVCWDAVERQGGYGGVHGMGWSLHRRRSGMKYEEDEEEEKEVGKEQSATALNLYYTDCLQALREASGQLSARSSLDRCVVESAA